MQAAFFKRGARSVLILTALVMISCSGNGSSLISYSAIDADVTKSPAADSANYNVPGVALGISFSGTSVTFTTWDPSGIPTLCLYASAGQSINAPSATYAMTLSSDANEGGIYRYSASLGTAAGGIDTSATPFYTYKSKAGSFFLDPYAPSMALWKQGQTGDSIGKGAIIDITTQLPDAGNWTTNLAGAGSVYFDGSKMQNGSGGTDSYSFSSNRDAVIYEAGVRDFTVDSTVFGSTGTDLSSGLGTTPFGTYKAFAKMLPHIRNLGVTHVQILCPLQNYYYDQTKISTRETSQSATSGCNYNWGYDPQNYFTVSGMYSANPADPAARINEFMTMVDTIHSYGMGCIVDVVFNHTANKSVLPFSNYYYRTVSNSGCGNDTRSEAKMMRKLIVDAVVNLVQNYKVDGFRFDLMGIIDNETIKAAYAAAKAINPKVIFVGEGWNQYSGVFSDYNGTAIFGSEQQHADFFNGSNIAMFSDSFRNILKNGYPNDGGSAFISGGAQSLSALFKNISGIPTNSNPSFNLLSTNNLLNYMTAHDNLTLYDAIVCATNSAKTADDTVLKRAKIGYVILMTSQGAAFIHGGDEMFRSKETTAAKGAANTKSSSSGRVFCDNSYNASDAINRIVWSNVYAADPILTGFTNYDTSKNGYKLYSYVQGLIALRKSTDAFRLADSSISARVTSLSSTSSSGLTLAYKAVNSDGTKTYYVFCNASETSASFTISEALTSAALIVDGMYSGTSTISSSSVAVIGTVVTVPALTAAVFSR